MEHQKYNMKYETVNKINEKNDPCLCFYWNVTDNTNLCLPLEFSYCCQMPSSNQQSSINNHPL